MLKKSISIVAAISALASAPVHAQVLPSAKCMDKIKQEFLLRERLPEEKGEEKVQLTVLEQTYDEDHPTLDRVLAEIQYTEWKHRDTVERYIVSFDGHACKIEWMHFFVSQR